MNSPTVFFFFFPGSDRMFVHGDLPGANENTVMTVGMCLISYILRCPAFCCHSCQKNKVYSYVF